MLAFLYLHDSTVFAFLFIFLSVFEIYFRFKLKITKILSKSAYKDKNPSNDSYPTLERDCMDCMAIYCDIFTFYSQDVKCRV